MTPATGYAATLRTPGLARLVAASVVARIPAGFSTLATVLVVRDASGSFAVAGLAAGAETLTAAASAPVTGRLVDRLGQTRVLVPTAFVNATAMCALAAAALTGAPDGALVALAAVAGVCPPPISPALRTLLTGLLTGVRLESGYAIEAIVQEGVFLIGPLLIALTVAVANAAAALIVGGVLVLAGTLWFAAAPASRAWRGTPARDRHPLGALHSPVVRLLVFVSLGLGTCFGFLDVALPAFAREEGRPGLAGVLAALIAVGSITGGLVAGRRAWRRSLATRLAGFLLALAVLLAPLALVRSMGPMGVLLVVAGLPIAPAATCLYTLLGEAAPRGMITESFTWLATAFPSGIAAGAAVAGVLVDASGPGAAFAASAALAGVSAGVALAGHRRLAAPPGPPGTAEAERLSPEAAEGRAVESLAGDPSRRR